MNSYDTSAGTRVLEMSEEEYSAYLESEVRASVGMTIEEFTTAADRGEIDWDEPDAFYVAGLLGVGQNGHRRTA